MLPIVFGLLVALLVVGAGLAAKEILDRRRMMARPGHVPVIARARWRIQDVRAAAAGARVARRAAGPRRNVGAVPGRIRAGAPRGHDVPKPSRRQRPEQERIDGVRESNGQAGPRSNAQVVVEKTQRSSGSLVATPDADVSKSVLEGLEGQAFERRASGQRTRANEAGEAGPHRASTKSAGSGNGVRYIAAANHRRKWGKRRRRAVPAILLGLLALLFGGSVAMAILVSGHPVRGAASVGDYIRHKPPPAARPSTRASSAGTRAPNSRSRGRGPAGATNAPKVIRPVAVTVLNGTTTNGLALTASHLLAHAGFHAGRTGNAEAQTHSRTIVSYLPGYRPQAVRMAKTLHGARVRPMDPKTLKAAHRIPGPNPAVVVTMGADRSSLAH